MPIVTIGSGEKQVQEEMLSYLNENVFTPILSSSASSNAKAGTRETVRRLEKFIGHPEGSLKMNHFFWAAVSGTERSIRFYEILQSQNLPSFESEMNEFRKRWIDDWQFRRKVK